MKKSAGAFALLGTIAFSATACNDPSGYFAPLPVEPPSVPGNGGGISVASLKSIQPAFAVRGLNCMTCHGVIGSNVVTDFGYGSANYVPMFSALPGITNSGRTAFNDIQSGWQTVQISGSLHVPKIPLTADEADTEFGVSEAGSLASFLQMPKLGGNANPMTTGITPPAGQNAVVENSSITITYPSESEITALLPSNLQTAAAAISTIALDGVTNTAVTGLAVDPSGKYVMNTTGTVSCYGDIAIKGPLFLNNVDLVTDSNGCRLYVAGTVFIQGPITHVNGSLSNLQISSSRAIVMGFSTTQLGALTSAPAANAPSTVRVASQNDPAIVTSGGAFARFAVEFDTQYNPGKANINGVAPTTFFDNIVSDSLLIGSKLVDAGEPAAFNNLVAGESVVTDASDGGSYGGKRVAINYSGLLLNAPHIHSRYGGTLSGVIIGDVAMLARNQSIGATAIEQYTYDQRFNNVLAILPALSTTILDLQP